MINRQIGGDELNKPSQKPITTNFELNASFNRLLTIGHTPETKWVCTTSVSCTKPNCFYGTKFLNVFIFGNHLSETD